MIFSEESMRRWLSRHREWFNQPFKNALKPLLRRLGFVVEDWEESDHPRDESGRFASSGGGGSEESSKDKEKSEHDKRRARYEKKYEDNKYEIERQNRAVLKDGDDDDLGVRHGIMTNYDGLYKDKIGTDCSHNYGNHTYFFFNYGHDMYRFTEKVPIESHKEYDDRIKKRFKKKKQRRHWSWKS